MTLAILKHRLRRLRAIPLHETRDLVRAQWYLLVARAQRRWTRVGRFVELLATGDGALDAAASLDTATRALGERLATAVERAAGHGVIRATCLERALALNRLLRHHGVTQGQIRVGVRLEDGQFLAHAWVELGDTVLADAPGRVRAFTTIAAAGAAAP